MENILTLKPLEESDLENIIFAPTYFQKTARIEKVISECIPGLTVISGNRGIGKSTTINYYLEKIKEKKNRNHVFFRFNLTTNNSSFYRDIFSFIETINFESDIKNQNLNNNLNSLIEELRDDIFFTIVHEKINNEEQILSTEEKGGIEALIKIPLQIFKFKTKLSSDFIDKASETQKTQIIKSKNFYKDDIHKRLINILNLLSDYYDIMFIIDELDKMSETDFNNFILENKTLFLESKVSFILILDKEKCLDVKYNNPLIDSIIREYVHLSNLEWSEFLIIASRRNVSRSLNEYRELFYLTRGNFRKLINHQINHKNSYRNYTKTNILICFYIYRHFINIPLINNLPIIIKDIIKDYLFEILDLFLLIGPLGIEDVERIGKYYNNKNVFPIISKLKEEIIRFTNINDVLTAEETDLWKEISKYHEPKKVYYNSLSNTLHKYKLEIFNSSDLSDWKYFIEAWFDSIDFICITKQEKENIDINYISYHCNFFVSNGYLEPTLFLNNNGIAWIHEVSGRKNDLVKYLKKMNLMYIEIDLEKGVYNEEFFMDRDNLYNVEKIVLEKYDSIL